ncbi:2-hydroxyisoflavanone dehydratase [Jatropha curcas]|uniref:2-hydroxyisoflavanone dehydratase n=1 Tax=Jatropha curcas TaxID=180498 RepID=UPI0005FC130E|nr:2-hydroxyisoflavanone dehydratase [Jatropha curcas]
MDSTGKELKEVAAEVVPFIRVFKDGSVERLTVSSIVPPFQDLETGVLSKDIIISKDPPISARLYLPNLTEPNQKQKLPILVYFHGGGFCIDSAFSLNETKYMNSLVSQAKVVAISVEYRLAPEHPLPVAYHDCWAALRWVASHSAEENTEPWISNHGDFSRLFVGGDSAGANIAHNIAMRASNEALPGNVKILGSYFTHPYFWGSKPIGSEYTEEREKRPAYMIWNIVYPSAPGGIDNPMMNPIGPDAPSLAGLGCSRLFISVAENDTLRDRGFLYYNAVKKSGWGGEIEIHEVEGEVHAFHIRNCDTENAKNLIKHLASFLSKRVL